MARNNELNEILPTIITKANKAFDVWNKLSTPTKTAWLIQLTAAVGKTAQLATLAKAVHCSAGLVEWAEHLPSKTKTIVEGNSIKHRIAPLGVIALTSSNNNPLPALQEAFIALGTGCAVIVAHPVKDGRFSALQVIMRRLGFPPALLQNIVHDDMQKAMKILTSEGISVFNPNTESLTNDKEYFNLIDRFSFNKIIVRSAGR